MSPTAPDRKRSRLPAALGCLLAALLVVAAPAATGQDGARMDQSQQELERVRARMQALNRRLEQDRGRQGALREELEAAEREVAGMQAELRRLRDALRAQTAQVAQAERARAEAEAGLRRHKQALAAQVRAAYVMGSRARTRLLLNFEDSGQVGRQLTYFDYLNRARAAQMASLHQQLDRLAALAAGLEQERGRLQALETEQARALDALDAGREARKRSMARLDARIAGQLDELKELQADEREIQKLLESLRESLADIPVDLGAEDQPFGALRGRLPWPVRGKLLADYGDPKAGGRLSWNGRWIAAREGAPVRAVARGRVAYVGWMQRYGLMVIVEHEGGYYSLYGHNAAATRSAGEWVKAGEVLASAGNTGGHEQSGVYLEIRKGSTALDPRQWLGK